MFTSNLLKIRVGYLELIFWFIALLFIVSSAVIIWNKRKRIILQNNAKKQQSIKAKFNEFLFEVLIWVTIPILSILFGFRTISWQDEYDNYTNYKTKADISLLLLLDYQQKSYNVLNSDGYFPYLYFENDDMLHHIYDLVNDLSKMEYIYKTNKSAKIYEIYKVILWNDDLSVRSVFSDFGASEVERYQRGKIIFTLTLMKEIIDTISSMENGNAITKNNDFYLSYLTKISQTTLSDEITNLFN